MHHEDELMPKIIKRFLFVNRRAPYGTIYAHESLELILIAAAFEQDVSVVFMDDGVFQLQNGQNTTAVGIKNFSPTFKALAGYDVDKLYVEKESMDSRGLTEDDLVVPVVSLSSIELQELMDAQDIILSS